MTSSADGDDPQPWHLKKHSTAASTPSLDVPDDLLSRSGLRLHTPRAASLSRSASPHGSLSLSRSGSRLGRSLLATAGSVSAAESYDELRSIIVRAFSPLVAVYPTQELDDLARAKGATGGFTALIRPYGEHVVGKVVVRDSVGASRAWDDFGVHFADLGRLAYDAAAASTTSTATITSPPNIALDTLEQALETLLENEESDGYYYHSDDDDGNHEDDDKINDNDDANGHTTPRDHALGRSASPLYKAFLNRLLSSNSISPHETLMHPVAAVIAISSATEQPIETLRQLYHQTSQGTRALPPYANPEYLRYYVLVHDEDRDDLSKSTALFDQMKRHFGLHCHLLKLRSSVVSLSDDNAEVLPQCEWVSPSDEAQQVAESNPALIQASEAVAIRTFVRELVTQSIVPHMEQRMTLWNEQVASRRRGISGRFLSISKRWAGIGSSGRNSSSGSSTGNYDSLQGYYRYDSSEAILRKLADFALMLRDFKLAASTFELVRSDYNNDKAWKYAAGANEMCCITNLLNPLTGTAAAKLKMESFDQMLDTACYSYLTRCNDPTRALRALLLGVELLKVRGKQGGELAAKWGIRILQLGLVGSCGHALLSERIASCFANQIGFGHTSWGTRKRKAAMWNVTAADDWMKLGRAAFAAETLDQAKVLYGEALNGSGSEAFNTYTDMSTFTAQLTLAVQMKLSQGQGPGKGHTSRRGRERTASGASFVMSQDVEDETVEQMAAGDTANAATAATDRRLMQRRSLVGGSTAAAAAAAAAAAGSGTTGTNPTTTGAHTEDSILPPTSCSPILPRHHDTLGGVRDEDFE